MSHPIRVRKISHHDGTTEIKYEVRTPAGWDKLELTTKDEPKPSFLEALQALSSDLLTISELPVSAKHNITIRRVSFKHVGETVGVVISGNRDINDGPGVLTINTPYRQEAGDSLGEEAGGALPHRTAAKLYKLITETEDFIKGRRKQIDMFQAAEDEADHNGQLQEASQAKGKAKGKSKAKGKAQAGA